ncbi:MAG TPA: NeuD/PglB/VioB family sugar acetyltransferase [Cyclobacteriaceae bacterium]|nr:NeuD/PglB/VioB family sugar acetyltransferase [Cyclobacteriaceae bacterium]
MMEKPVIILGAGGIGRMALEIFTSLGIIVYGFLDDDKSLTGTEIQHVKVLGTTSDDGFLKLIGHKCEAFIAADNNALRKSLVKMLNEKRKVMPVNAIHKYARIAESVYLEYDLFINDSVIAGTNSRFSSHSIIHSGAIIGYDAVIGPFVQVGSGSIIGDGARIGDEVFIGTGAIIIPGLIIGKRARIGAGSVVTHNVAEDETVFGNPAQSVKT